MKKQDFQYKIEKIIEKISFRFFLFKVRIKYHFTRKDVESNYPHLYYHNVNS